MEVGLSLGARTSREATFRIVNPETNAMRLSRVRFTVRKAMVLVAVLSVPLAFWAWRLRAGIAFPIAFDLVPLAVTISSAFVFVRVLTRDVGKSSRLLGPVGWGLMSFNALLAVWFTSVEWAWIQEDCMACGHGRNVVETRFFSASSCRRIMREYPTETELIAKELRVPCAHERMTRWRKQRWLGGCLPVDSHNGISRLWDPPWFPPCARDAVRSWAAEDPTFVRTFRKRTLEGHERKYVRGLILRMYDACPADQLPEYRLNRDPES
jgi:hypothetical protein